jgi:hypothetical protein
MESAESMFREYLLCCRLNRFLDMMVLNEIKNWLENDPEKNKNEIKYILDEKREVYESENKKLEELKCDCLPNCSDLSYDVEISQSDLHWNEQILSYDRNGKK